MLKKIVFISLLSVSSAIMAASITAVKKLATALSGFKTYSAHFSQKTYANKTLIQQSSGLVWIARPGKFRWETKEPMDQLLLVNGDVVWSYDVDLAQATKRTLTKKNALNAAFLLSGSMSQLVKGFNVSENKAGDFILLPKQPMSFDRIELRFLHHALVEMKTSNTLGQKTTYMFTQIKLNPALASSLFTFHPPKGVDVLS